MLAIQHCFGDVKLNDELCLTIFEYYFLPISLISSSCCRTRTSCPFFSCPLFSGTVQLLPPVLPHITMNSPDHSASSVLVSCHSFLNVILCILSFVQTDATKLANNSQHCWMLHAASVCTPCCMLLDDAAQSLKLVKLLAPFKWTQHYSRSFKLWYWTYKNMSPWHSFLVNFCPTV